MLLLIYSFKKGGVWTMKRLILILPLVLLFSLFGCGQRDLKDNQVYIVEDFSKNKGQENLRNNLNTEGSIPFQEYQDIYPREEELEGKVLLSVSPSGKSMYFMSASNLQLTTDILKGDTWQLVDIYRKDKEGKDFQVIAEGIPFVSQVKWNKDGNVVAFGGGEKLTIYDAKKDKLLLEEKLKNDSIVFFAWSPKDDNKLYAENPSLANGSIYYIDSQKKVEAYETKEDIYYKGNLDNNYFYGTKWYIYNDKKNKESINTIIVDKKGNVVKVLAEGKFRDAYKKSLVQIGENGFGLYYIRDINKPENIDVLSKEYIYDVKFVDKGKIAYIIEKKDISKNNFQLIIADKQGKEVKKLDVSGSNIALLPNGKVGFISGPNWEKIDFVNNKIEKVLYDVEMNPEKEKVYSVIRGAMDTICKYEACGIKDWNQAKKYFIDTVNPEQWAYFDIYTKFKESAYKERENFYKLNLKVIENKFNFMQNKVSVKVRAEARNSTGGETVLEYPLELIKINKEWYVTGISTFPDSSQYQKVYNLVNDYIKDIKAGKIFPNILENKEMEMGQIQFWRSNLPHLSSNIEGANSCKVYLKVKENNKRVIYKLILEKKNDNNWKPISLTKENLSFL